LSLIDSRLTMDGALLTLMHTTFPRVNNEFSRQSDGQLTLSLIEFETHNGNYVRPYDNECQKLSSDAHTNASAV